MAAVGEVFRSCRVRGVLSCAGGAQDACVPIPHGAAHSTWMYFLAGPAGMAPEEFSRLVLAGKPPGGCLSQRTLVCQGEQGALVLEVVEAVLALMRQEPSGALAARAM